MNLFTSIVLGVVSMLIATTVVTKVENRLTSAYLIWLIGLTTGVVVVLFSLE